MGYVPLEKLLPKSGHSIYRLMAMASKRAMELADHAPRLIEIPSSQKTATIALEEIAFEKVGLKGVSVRSGSIKGARGKDSSKQEKIESVQV